MTQSESADLGFGCYARNHEWFRLDTSKGQGGIIGQAVEDRFKCLINSDIFLNMMGLVIPVQIVDWAIRINTNLASQLHGHAVVQWQFKPKHGEGTVWIDSTSDEYSVISSA
jgi:hypothetical protein